MKAFKYFILAVLAIPMLAQASSYIYLKNLDEIMGYVISELSSGGKESIERSKIDIKNVDVNNDGKLDYFVLYYPLQCGSGGCSPSIFLKTDEGYCVTEGGGGKAEDDTSYPDIKCMETEY